MQMLAGLRSHNQWIPIDFVLLGLLFSLSPASAFKICLVTNPGFANCTPGAPASTFTGMDVELIRQIAATANWTEVPDGQLDNYYNVSDPSQRRFSFVCTSIRVAAVVNILTNTTEDSYEQCAMGAGAFTATQARVQQGTRFSWPHLRTGLGVLISEKSSSTSYDKWAFLRPFSPSVWAALVVTAGVVPLLLFIIENMMQTGRIPVGMGLLTEWRHATYTMFLCCFNLQVLEVLSLPSQLLIICFCFTNLILVASYTANLAAVLTSAASQTGYQTINDLRGLTVNAHGVYLDRLARNERVYASRLDWQGEPTFLQVKELLEEGSIQAYIFDKPILQYWLLKDNQDCTLGLTKDSSLEPFDYGVAFHRLVPQEIVNEFNLGVLGAQSQNLLNDLQEKYLGNLDGQSACNSNGAYSDALQFAQISGLWIVSGSIAGFGLLCCVWAFYHHHVHKPRRKRSAMLEALKKHKSTLALSMHGSNDLPGAGGSGNTPQPSFPDDDPEAGLQYHDHDYPGFYKGANSPDGGPEGGGGWGEGAHDESLQHHGYEHYHHSMHGEPSAPVPLQQQQAYSRASSRFNPAYLGGSGEIPHADHTVVSMHGQDRQIELGAMGSHDDRSLPGGYKLEEESQLGSSRVQSPSAREGGEVALSLAMLPSLPQLRATLEDGLLNSPQKSPTSSRMPGAAAADTAAGAFGHGGSVFNITADASAAATHARNPAHRTNPKTSFSRQSTTDSTLHENPLSSPFQHPPPSPSSASSLDLRPSSIPSSASTAQGFGAVFTGPAVGPEEGPVSTTGTADGVVLEGGTLGASPGVPLLGHTQVSGAGAMHSTPPGHTRNTLGQFGQPLIGSPGLPALLTVRATNNSVSTSTGEEVAPSFSIALPWVTGAPSVPPTTPVCTAPTALPAFEAAELAEAIDRDVPQVQGPSVLLLGRAGGTTGAVPVLQDAPAAVQQMAAGSQELLSGAGSAANSRSLVIPSAGSVGKSPLPSGAAAPLPSANSSGGRSGHSGMLARAPSLKRTPSLTRSGSLQRSGSLTRSPSLHAHGKRRFAGVARALLAHVAFRHRLPSMRSRRSGSGAQVGLSQPLNSGGSDRDRMGSTTETTAMSGWVGNNNPDLTPASSIALTSGLSAGTTELATMGSTLLTPHTDDSRATPPLSMTGGSQRKVRFSTTELDLPSDITGTSLAGIAKAGTTSNTKSGTTAPSPPQSQSGRPDAEQGKKGNRKFRAVAMGAMTFLQKARGVAAKVFVPEGQGHTYEDDSIPADLAEEWESYQADLANRGDAKHRSFYAPSYMATQPIMTPFEQQQQYEEMQGVYESRAAYASRSFSGAIAAATASVAAAAAANPAALQQRVQANPFVVPVHRQPSVLVVPRYASCSGAPAQVAMMHQEAWQSPQQTLTGAGSTTTRFGEGYPDPLLSPRAALMQAAMQRATSGAPGSAQQLSAGSGIQGGGDSAASAGTGARGAAGSPRHVSYNGSTGGGSFPGDGPWGWPELGLPPIMVASARGVGGSGAVNSSSNNSTTLANAGDAVGSGNYSAGVGSSSGLFSPGSARGGNGGGGGSALSSAGNTTHHPPTSGGGGTSNAANVAAAAAAAAWARGGGPGASSFRSNTSSSGVPAYSRLGSLRRGGGTVTAASGPGGSGGQSAMIPAAGQQQQRAGAGGDISRLSSTGLGSRTFSGTAGSSTSPITSPPQSRASVSNAAAGGLANPNNTSRANRTSSSGVTGLDPAGLTGRLSSPASNTALVGVSDMGALPGGYSAAVTMTAMPSMARSGSASPFTGVPTAAGGERTTSMIRSSRPLHLEELSPNNPTYSLASAGASTQQSLDRRSWTPPGLAGAGGSYFGGPGGGPGNTFSSPSRPGSMYGGSSGGPAAGQGTIPLPSLQSLAGAGPSSMLVGAGASTRGGAAQPGSIQVTLEKGGTGAVSIRAKDGYGMGLVRSGPSAQARPKYSPLVTNMTSKRSSLSGTTSGTAPGFGGGAGNTGTAASLVRPGARRSLEQAQGLYTAGPSLAEIQQIQHAAASGRSVHHGPSRSSLEGGEQSVRQYLHSRSSLDLGGAPQQQYNAGTWGAGAVPRPRQDSNNNSLTGGMPAAGGNRSGPGSGRSGSASPPPYTAVNQVAPAAPHGPGIIFVAAPVVAEGSSFFGGLASSGTGSGGAGGDPSAGPSRGTSSAAANNAASGTSSGIITSSAGTGSGSTAVNSGGSMIASGGGLEMSPWVAAERNSRNARTTQNPSDPRYSRKT